MSWITLNWLKSLENVCLRTSKCKLARKTKQNENKQTNNNKNRRKKRTKNKTKQKKHFTLQLLITNTSYWSFFSPCQYAIFTFPPSILSLLNHVNVSYLIKLLLCSPAINLSITSGQRGGRGKTRFISHASAHKSRGGHSPFILV